MRIAHQPFILGILLAAIIGSACGKKQDTIYPTVEAISASVYASGTIKSNNQYEVYSKVNGLIKKVLVKEGDLVKKGQPIFQLANTAQVLGYENAQLLANYSSEQSNNEKLIQAKNELEVAKLKLDNESSLLERQKKLWANEIGTQNEIDQRTLSYKNAVSAFNASTLKVNDLKKQIEFQAKQSKKSEAISNTTMNDYVVVSNLEGRIYSINKLEGEMANTQSSIATIGDANVFYVELQVDEYDISKIKLGQKVILSMDSYKGKTFEAVIQKVYPIMNPKSKSFKVDAYFSKQPENLFPNLSAQANIIIEVKDKAITIPRAYLIDNEFVFLANKEKRKVKVGLMDYEKVEILSGITTSDALVKTIQ